MNDDQRHIETMKEAGKVINRLFPEAHAGVVNTGGGTMCLMFMATPDLEVMCGFADVQWGCDLTELRGDGPERVGGFSLGLPVADYRVDDYSTVKAATPEQLACALLGVVLRLRQNPAAYIAERR
jgi:hypothetical protein